MNIRSIFVSAVVSLIGMGCATFHSESAKAGQWREPSSATCSVKDHQAIGDGKANDTAAIQSTIDSCPPGGTVVLPSGGTFLSGTIKLKSNLVFRVEPGAKLLGTQDNSQYPDLFPVTAAENTQTVQCKKALIYGVGLENVVIEGGTPSSDPSQVNLTASGVIDGNGENNPNWNGPEATRPMAIFIALSQNVKIHYVQVVNSGMWSVVNFENTHVVLQYVRVNSSYGPERDGMDVVDSTDVLVDHCDINSQDDSVCLKSGSLKGLHHVIVQNSHLRNSGVANALKIGTASVGPIDDIHFENVQIDAAKQAAMAVESVDGSAINGVSFKNIKFNSGTAFFILLGQRQGSKSAGSIENIRFENITGSVNSNWASAISGTNINGQIFSVSNLSFKNITVTELSGGGLNTIPRNPPEYDGEYPDPRMKDWSPLPAFGIYFRHASRVSLVNTVFKLSSAAQGDKRSAIDDQDDVSGLTQLNP